MQSFFQTYYAPSNAALIISGDFDPQQALTWVKQYFGDIPRSKLPPQPDISEPRQELQGMKNYLAGTFVLQNASRGGIRGQLRFMDLHELPDSFLEDYVKNVMAVTPEDVRQMARKYLKDEKWSWSPPVTTRPSRSRCGPAAGWW